ncbi:ATP-dependent helicase [Butyrivibrio sp. XB500-5]|uniref:UvrD-helicase domain-containing protein n=1 Tax=Butyrivibrio sp. XB500-5 TaxID=2364880 RepID=UPI000EA962F7|nr:UvrD-helicase domain-containing protein [Butyrivibrio sp. XB500-5]RKM63015.1 ATP-dependent helicase [Butyrivibrio sp. XB500-5]
MSDKATVAISADFLTAYAALPRQKQGKVTEFFNKFRNDPTHPGINFEKINEGIDKNICSVRIDDTYRGIVVREPESNVYILLWVDHHDEAYDWAKRKKCSINKLTGSVQIFDVKEVIEEQKAIDEPALFRDISDDVFARIGLPEEQLPMVKAIKTLEGLHSMKGAIPEEAFEGLEWLGNGFTVEEVLSTLYPETDHVDVKENDFAAALQTDASKKSFVIVDGEEELQAIMQEPLEKWRIFLHPTQRKVVGKKFSGPARVLGGAGTGKTVVAMHRAKMLAETLEPGKKILFTTYTKNLAEDIKDNLRKICIADEMKRIDIINLDAWVSNFLRRQGYEYQIVYDDEVDKAWKDALAITGGELSFVDGFYKDEWVKVVQAQEVYDKVSYCKAPRLGRGVRLDRKVRMQLWDVFDEYQNIMNERQQRDVETAMYECRKILESKNMTGQYDSVIVDEGQDLSPSAYRLLRALAGDEHENDIFIVGDSHQRIYRNKAVLSKCGINVRGRSSYLRINYRTTEEIRKFAFALLNGVSFDDLDEAYDNDKGCQSLTHGDKPEISEFATPEEELDFIVKKIKELEANGVEQKNICIVARTHRLLDNYVAGLQRAGIKSFEIKANKTDDRSFEGVRIATMHRVKGLEFDHVFAVAVNKKVLPFGTKADFEDDISLEEFRTGEKCLLYVALTRARKSAYVTCYGGLSELVK